LSENFSIITFIVFEQFSKITDCVVESSRPLVPIGLKVDFVKKLGYCQSLLRFFSDRWMERQIDCFPGKMWWTERCFRPIRDHPKPTCR